MIERTHGVYGARQSVRIGWIFAEGRLVRLGPEFDAVESLTGSKAFGTRWEERNSSAISFSITCEGRVRVSLLVFDEAAATKRTERDSAERLYMFMELTTTVRGLPPITTRLPTGIPVGNVLSWRR